MLPIQSGRAGIAVLLVFTAALAAGQTPTALPLDDAFAIKTFQIYDGGAQVSPDSKWAASVVCDPAARAKDKAGKMTSLVASRGAAMYSWGCDIVVSRLDGTAERNVTGGIGNNWAPSWSPDGKTLAFFSDRDGKTRLWSWDFATGKARRVSDAVVRVGIGLQRAIWLPGGSEVVVPLHPDGMSEDELDVGLPGHKVDARPEPDAVSGSTVKVYRSGAAAKDAEKTSGKSVSTTIQRYITDIARIDLASGKASVVVRRANQIRLIPSPDGTRLLYSELKPGSGLIVPLDIVVVDLATGVRRVLATDVPSSFEASAVWSPEGDRISLPRQLRVCERHAADRGRRGHARIARRRAREGRRCAEFRADRGGRRVRLRPFQPGVEPGWKEHLPRRRRPRLEGDRCRRTRRSADSEARREDHEHRPCLRRSDVVGTRLRSDRRHDLGFGDAQVRVPGRRCRRQGDEPPRGAEALRDAIRPSSSDSRRPRGDLRRREQRLAGRPVDDDPGILAARPRHAPESASREVPSRRVAHHRVPERGRRDAPGGAFPSGRYEAGKRYPLIALVYASGMGSRSVNSFGIDYMGEYNYQILTTRGYAILTPDIPVRTGTPMRDLMKAVPQALDRVIELGIADPDRLGVTGQSNGGYSTLALICQTNRFKAAVMNSGFGDLVGFYGSMNKNDGSGGWHPWLEKLGGAMGVPPWEAPMRYVENSPIFYLDRVQTPLLMQAGADDEGIVEYSDQVYVGMKRLNKDVTYLRYRDESHLLERHANKLDYWSRVLPFWEKHLKPAP
jgi:dipeptidyl aminopeptidase/acylaminoacyl peptidase